MSAFSKAKGFTLIELGVVIALLAILASFAVASFLGSGETRDATMVQAAQASLQQVISQASVRMDMSPAELLGSNSANVLTAAQQLVLENGGGDQGVTFTASGTDFTMSIPATGRGATYTVTPTGDVALNSLNGPWEKYEEEDGVIRRL